MNNIVLISIDNLRFDCIGCQPDKKELIKYDVVKYLETPTLDKIAEKSLCFTRCISTNTYTTAAHASILTGLYPPRHGVRAFYETKLSDEVYTLAEVLKTYGYVTVMMTDIVNLFRPLNLHRGFDYIFHNDDNGLMDFLKSNKGEKTFLFVHFFDVHEPFLMSENDAYDNSDYRKEVDHLYEIYDLNKYRSPDDSDKGAWRRLLDQVGRKDHKNFLPLYIRGVSKFDRGRFGDFMSLLELSGFLEGSQLILCADHGEGKSSSYDPEGFSHGGMLFDSVIRVPLLIYHPDLSHKVVDRIVSLVDIFPTIFAMALGLDARNLLPYESDGIDICASPTGNRAVYSETWQRDNNKLLIPTMFVSSFLGQRAIRTENTKCIINGTPEIFSENNAIEHMSNEEFIQNVYRGLFCRFEDYNDYYLALQDLNEGIMDRATFLKAILNSSEYKSRQPYGIYDLHKDPYEENPLRMDEGKGIQEDITRHFDMIKRISEKTKNTDDIFPDDEETIIGIMKNAFQDEWEIRAGIMVNNKHLFSCVVNDFIIHMRDKDLVYKRKHFKDVVLASEEFSLFLRERILALEKEPSTLRNFLKRYISYNMRLKLFDLFFLKIFPRETVRGHVWHRIMAKLLNV
jgi:arylsulfatase A-like enzyme